jgi:hypothetical protein
VRQRRWSSGGGRLQKPAPAKAGGHVADPATLSGQVAKLKQRFHLDRVVLVGDPRIKSGDGMITETRIETLLRPAGLNWITALRAPTIKALVDQGAFQLSLFDERDLAKVTSPAFPDERLVVCRTPLLAGERARKRQDLLAATEADLASVAKAVTRQRRPLRGADRIGLAAGAVLNRHRMAKPVTRTMTEDHCAFVRNQDAIEAESQLDGIYLIRTNLAADHLAAAEVVRSYKDLSRAERAFRSLKTVDLEIRPIHHRLPDRVRGHVLLCMLAYYVEWHMRQALAPVLFDDAAGIGVFTAISVPLYLRKRPSTHRTQPSAALREDSGSLRRSSERVSH